MKMKYFPILFLALVAFSCSQESASLEANGQSGSITRFTVYNGYMYGLNPNGVLTFSLENPDMPELVHTLPTDYGLETIFIYEGTVYLGSRTGLYILDISNPAQPVLLSKTDREQLFFNGCDPVVVSGNYAYSTVKIIVNICGTAAAQSALLVYDVTDKENPSQIGLYPHDLPNGLGIKGNYLVVCDEGADKLNLYDISNPASLVQLTDFEVDITDPIDLIISGDKMIVSTRQDFQIYDVSNMEDIRKIGQIEK